MHLRNGSMLLGVLGLLALACRPEERGKWEPGRQYQVLLLPTGADVNLRPPFERFQDTVRLLIRIDSVTEVALVGTYMPVGGDMRGLVSESEQRRRRVSGRLTADSFQLTLEPDMRDGDLLIAGANRDTWPLTGSWQSAGRITATGGFILTPEPMRSQ